MSKPPNAIWLQWHGDENERVSAIEPDGEGVTWCEDQIYERDIRYVIDKRYKPRRNKAKPGGER